MTIAARPLTTTDQLRCAVRVQTAVLGSHTGSVWQLPHLVDVTQTGGLVLGAYVDAGTPSESCQGVVVDLVADVDGYPARRTVSWSVPAARANRGLGTLLREAERRLHQKTGVDLVYWDIDPLNSPGLHVSLNKLGGIATGFTQEATGGAQDALAPGLGTDRLRLEWWIDSPRVIQRMDDRRSLPHEAVGLHEMTVLTTTTLRPSGVRGLMDDVRPPESKYALMEIPESLSDVEARDRDAAIQWRLRSRSVLAQLFAAGYLGVGLIHEGGRTFLVFKQGTRRTELSAAQRR